MTGRLRDFRPADEEMVGFSAAGFRAATDVSRAADFRPSRTGATERVDRANENAEEFLQELSDTTAGRFYSSKNGKLKKTFEMIVEELRFQYRLGFYPPEDANEKTLHELKVKVARSDTVVRSRSGYRVQKKTN